MNKTIILLCTLPILSGCFAPGQLAEKQAQYKHDGAIVGRAFTKKLEQECMDKSVDPKHPERFKIVGKGYYNGRFSEFNPDTQSKVVFSIPMQTLNLFGESVPNETNCAYLYDPKERSLTFIEAYYYNKPL